MTRVPSQALLGYKMFASWFNCSARRADAGAGADVEPFSPVNEILVARSSSTRDTMASDAFLVPGVCAFGCC